MTISTSIEVAGVKNVLREINDISPKARREITRNFKRITAPVVREAINNVPKAPPISGWGRTWRTQSGFQMLPWDGSKGASMIDTKVSGRRPKEFGGVIRDLAVLSIRWRGMVNTVYDLSRNAKTPQGANMIRGLEMNQGRASRVMWPAYERKKDDIENEIRDEIVRLMALVDRNINRGSF